MTRVGVDIHNSEGVPQGTRTMMLDLVRDLAAEAPDLEVAVYTGPRGRREPDVAALPIAARVHPIRHPHGVRRVAWDFPRAFARDALDVAYVLNFVPWWGRVPTVVNIADVLFLDHPEWFDRRFLRYAVPLTRHAVRRAQHVITISEQSRAALERHFGLPRSKVSVVYCGIRDDDSYSEPSQRRVRDGLPPRYLLAVGRFDERKNIRRLLEACARVIRAGASDLHLVLVGSSEGRWPELDRMIEDARTAKWLSVEQRVPAARLRMLYAGAEGLVFPSLGEGFGLPIIESFRHGRPAVLSDIPVFREIAGSAAMFAVPTSVDALAAAIATFWTDESLRATLAGHIPERVRLFDSRATARVTADILREVAQRRQARR